MSTIEDGGPAFPVPVGEREFWDRENDGSPNGMSLRDWFAGQALAGWMATYVGDKDNHPGQESTWAENVACDSYRIADAMLAARKGGQP